MSFAFWKVHGSGNDFVLVDGRRSAEDWAALAPPLCDRHYGVGADGVLVMASSSIAPVRMRMYNPDGSEAEMCGNGLRCFARHMVEQEGMVSLDGELAIETGAGVLSARFRHAGGHVQAVRIAMGEPVFDPARIPVGVEGPGPLQDLPLRAAEEDLRLTCLSMGNPHAVQFTETPVDAYALERVGPQVERHALFPQRTNFAIVNVLAPDHLRVRVWERGAGLTLACGTGACAALVAARLHERAATRATVSLPGGDLVIEWDGAGPVFLEGPAVTVYEGTWLTDGHA